MMNDDIKDDEEIQETEENDVIKKPLKAKKDKAHASQSGAERIGPTATFYTHAFLLFCGRVLNKTLDAYNSLFALTPKDKAMIYRNISTHYTKKGLQEKALSYLKEWTRLDPSDADAQYQLGVALSAAGETNSALKAFKKVLNLSPTHKGALYRKSALHLKLKDFKAAIEGLEKVCEKTPNNPKVHYLIGIAYDGLGEIDKAIEAVKKAIEINPTEIKYHQHLGFLNVRKDDHKAAAKHFTKVMELERELDEDDY
jgi:tetratricopeptide (TPR) repeat protein